MKVFNDVFNVAFPLKRVRVKRCNQQVSWWNNDLRDLRNRLTRIGYLRYSTDLVQRHNYNSLKQLYTSSIKNAKVKVKMETINASKNKGKALWNLLKSETKSRKPVENLKLDKNGNVTDDPAEIVNIFLDVFTPKNHAS